jgi:hypothetical protein
MWVISKGRHTDLRERVSADLEIDLGVWSHNADNLFRWATELSKGGDGYNLHRVANWFLDEVEAM